MLDKDSKTPLYKQLKEKLLNHIDENLSEGEPLPTEPEIENQYQVSRITVRKTIEELVADGIVTKRQGKGTFVRSKPIVQKAGTITSFTEEMSEKGKDIDTRGLEISETTPSKRLRDLLNLSPGESLITVKRIRCAGGEPIAIMINYLRKRNMPGFMEKGLQKESLYEQLEEDYGIQLATATERIRARLATDLEAATLEVEPDSAVLHITRISSLSDGTPFEVVEMVNRSDRYQYDIELNGRSKTKKGGNPS
ncbi:GntR family transcriptional regulator [Fictibacillus enclensis]|uniref:GntR family transcriptional regulator n=1 Tax=Fictibacillus enclensis TaxID=1017270 RepID=UPI0025A12599|nr:GntR family transcriptional regulator [Fictibacillus enclensis]MDM5338479.1 GntR family transcriptional regulator [Fictibacillus enclensis]